MKLRFLAPGMTLDGNGNLWVDIFADGVHVILGDAMQPGAARDRFVEQTKHNLAHLNVQRVRVFNCLDN